jgi:lysophospholipase L1-like esterase
VPNLGADRLGIELGRGERFFSLARLLIEPMKRFIKILLFALAAAFLAAAWPAHRLYVEISKARSENPLVWEEEIRAFEAAAREQPEPVNAVLFVGSSSIRLWSSLERDMHPLPVINRGFGGAKLGDLVHYAERLVNAYGPRAVVVFAGSNDLQPGEVKSPEALLASYQTFVASVRADLPQVPVYYIAITPSPLRWEIWPIAQETNALIRRFCDQEPGLHFIDTGPSLLDAQGEPDPANYRFDRLHLSAAGYQIWAELIRQRLFADLR